MLILTLTMSKINHAFYFFYFPSPFFHLHLNLIRFTFSSSKDWQITYLHFTFHFIFILSFCSALLTSSLLDPLLNWSTWMSHPSDSILLEDIEINLVLRLLFSLFQLQFFCQFWKSSIFLNRRSKSSYVSQYSDSQIMIDQKRLGVSNQNLGQGLKES